MVRNEKKVYKSSSVKMDMIDKKNLIDRYYKLISIK